MGEFGPDLSKYNKLTGDKKERGKEDSTLGIIESVEEISPEEADELIKAAEKEGRIVKHTSEIIDPTPRSNRGKK